MNGYFDDSSILRRIHRERAVALSGPRALLMQAAHPLAVSGLLAHSTALEEPYERLARTSEALSTIGFGTRAQADEVRRRVRAMHRRVRGRLPEAIGPYAAGTPYRADDPELLMWVLFTLVDSGLVVYRKYVASLTRGRGRGLLGGLQGDRQVVRAARLRPARRRSMTSTSTAPRCSVATGCS